MSLVEVEEIVREMHGDVKVLMTQVKSIEQHQRETNGSVRELKEYDIEAAVRQARMDGALGTLKYLIAVVLGIVSAGAAVAGTVLAIVARSS